MKNHRQFITAALLLAVAAFIIPQISIGKTVPLKRSLSDLSLQLGDWIGKEEALNPEIIQKLNLDDYILRYYHSTERKALGLYIGYYGRMREGAIYHSPKNCLPGNGWEIAEMETISIPSMSGVRINKAIIQKGLERQLVLYWYQDRGRTIASEYWAKIFLAWDAIWLRRTDGALVRINMPLGEDSSVTLRDGLAFVQLLLPELGDFLPGL